MEVPLIKKQTITHDTYMFVFQLPEPEIPLGLGVGHHITIHAVLKTKDHPEGEEILRKYTPTSKVEQKGTFDLVVKIYRANVHPKFPEGGLMTQYLDSLKIGEKIKISGPTGKFTYLGKGKATIERKTLENSNFKELGLIAGGTGITPMYQVMKSIVDDPNDPTKVNLLFANKSVDDILIKEELEALENDPRIKIYFTLDKAPAEGWKGFEGFVTKEMVQKTMPYPSNDVLICTCGPPLMNKMLMEHLAQLGYKDNNLFKF